jgi:hypothetical protein
MTPEQIEQVFGRGRLKMATGDHVEVFREAMVPGERRRYTKRFLATRDGDFGPWTDREWRILARLIGHGIRCVPDVVQFDGGAMGGTRLVQTYDAGITVDQWGALLPVSRGGDVRRHVFEDCAHWWALAHHCLMALDEIHALGLVHLDVKGDNICIPCTPADFDPAAPADRLQSQLAPQFARLALIDFAFSLVSRETLAMPLPIGWQKDYDYQSPRLLRALDAGRNGDLEPTRDLDWRCDLYSLAAMLKRYLPAERSPDSANGWTAARYDAARTLIFRLREAHDRDLPHWRPHAQFIDYTGARLDEPDLAASLADGWQLARDASAGGLATPLTPITPMTRVAPPVRSAGRATAITVVRSGRMRTPDALSPTVSDVRPAAAIVSGPARSRRVARRYALAASVAAVAVAAATAPPYVGDPLHPVTDRVRALFNAPRSSDEDVAKAAATEPRIPEDKIATATDDPAVDAAEREGTPPAATQSTAPPAVPSADPVAAPPASMTKAAPSTMSPPVQSSSASTGRAIASKRSPHSASRLSTPPPKNYADAARRPGTHAASSAKMLADARYAAVPAKVAEPSVIAVHSPPPPAKTSTPNEEKAPVVEPSRASNDVAKPPSANRAEPVAAPPATPSSPPPSPAQSAPPSAASVASAPRTQPHEPPRDNWRTQLASLFGMVRSRSDPPAPVEDRSATRPSAESLAMARAATDALARAATLPQPSSIVASANAATAPSASPPAAIVVEKVMPTSTAAPRTIPAPAAAPPDSTGVPLDYVPQDARNLAALGRRLLVDTVPQIAAQSEPDVARVLSTAAIARHPEQAALVVQTAEEPWQSESALVAISDPAPAYARRLHNDARRTLAAGGDVRDALELELQAFGANPRDPDIAGYLAMLHLRAYPSRAETARQLALYSIALSGSRRSTRYAEWGTFAAASALAGRDADAARAFLAEAALRSDADRSCQAALRAYASYGERLRAPVYALVQRVNLQGRAGEAPSCAWPAYWGAAARVTPM